MPGVAVVAWVKTHATTSANPGYIRSVPPNLHIRRNQTSPLPKRIAARCRFTTAPQRRATLAIMQDSQRLKTDLLALGLLAATVIVAVSLLSHDPADPPAAALYPPR